MASKPLISSISWFCGQVTHMRRTQASKTLLAPPAYNHVGTLNLISGWCTGRSRDGSPHSSSSLKGTAIWMTRCDWNSMLLNTFRRRTNVQQLTCNIDLSVLFIIFSFFGSPWAKTLCFEGESPGGKMLKKCEKSAEKCGKFWNDFAL